MELTQSRIKKKRGSLQTQNIFILYVFLVPAIIFTFLFAYLPMFSNYIAFLDYDFNNGWFGLKSPFVGFDNFKLFLGDPKFYAILWRSLWYSIVMMVSGFPAPLILALMINEIRGHKFKRTVQTVSYIPHFVSWVTVAGLFYLFLSTDPSGIVNNIIQAINPEADRINFIQNPKNFLPLMVISNLWKETGWGTILYLAALTGIDPQLYEAAKVDGAGRMRCMWNITLPGITPTMSILLIFALGGLFQTSFDQVFNLQNPMIRIDTDTLATYTYYKGIIGQQYSYSAALGLFQGLISFVLIMSTNFVTKRTNGVGII